MVNVKITKEVIKNIMKIQKRKNMKKFLCTLIAAVFSAAALTGCVPTEATDIQIDPLFDGGNGPVEIDFIQLNNDTFDNFQSTEPYVYVTDCDINGTNDPKEVHVTVTVFDDAGEENCDQFGAAILRNMNDAAAVQSGEFEMSDPTTFGNFWDSYTVFLEFSHETEKEAGEDPFYTLIYEAGDEIKLDPDVESYEAEWEKQMEIYQRNLVYDADGNIVTDEADE